MCPNPVNAGSREIASIATHAANHRDLQVGRLPGPEELSQQLLESADASMDVSAGALKGLLAAHPAWVEYIASSMELRSLLQRTVAVVCETLEQDRSPESCNARVLWSVCDCVWQTVGLVVQGLVGRLPAGASKMECQLRSLMEQNDVLRGKLSTLRRDYLRELTELRERCRLLDPAVGVALAQLLQEEPVMFFEPFDFILDEATKDFVNATVEEKLKLIMLKGWKKGDDKRLTELEEENNELRAHLAKLESLGTVEEPLAAERREAEKRLHAWQGAANQLSDANHKDLRSQLSDLQLQDERHRSRIRELEDLLAAAEGNKVDVQQQLAVASQRVGKFDPETVAGNCKEDLATVDTRPCTAMSGDHQFDTSSMSNCAFMTAASHFGFGANTNSIGGAGENEKCHGHQDATNLEASSDADKWKRKHKNLRKEHEELQERYRKLEMKLARVCEKLKDQAGEEAVSDILKEIGLDRPKTPPPKNAFDRLYLDAQKRVVRLRDKAKALHDAEGEEVVRCAVAVAKVKRVRGAVARVQRLKEMHSQSVAAAAEIHDELEALQADAAQAAAQEGESSVAEESGNSTRPLPELPSNLPASPKCSPRAFAAAAFSKKPLRRCPSPVRGPRDAKTAPSPLMKASPMNAQGFNESRKDPDPARSTALPSTGFVDQNDAKDALDCSWTSQQSLRGIQRTVCSAFSHSGGHLPRSHVVSPPNPCLQRSPVVSPPNLCSRLSPEPAHQSIHTVGDTFRRAVGKGMLPKSDTHSRSLPSLPGNASLGPKGLKLRSGADSAHCWPQQKPCTPAGADVSPLCVRPLMGWLQAPKAQHT